MFLFLTASERNKESGSDQNTKSEIRTCEVSNVGKNCETINNSPHSFTLGVYLCFLFSVFQSKCHVV